MDDDEKKRADTSLRAKSLRRARDLQVPKTLTPYEWEQWYAEHGMPQSHKKAESVPRPSWWQFWKR
jgi:hypothetical protein